MENNQKVFSKNNIQGKYFIKETEKLLAFIEKTTNIAIFAI